MMKQLQRLLLIAFLLLPWATQAQDCTQTVPFSENFESYTGVAYNATTGRILPTCWTGVTTVVNYTPCVVSGTGSYVYTHGSNSMAMTGGTAATYGMNKYVLLPPMNVALNQLRLTFWMCTEQSSATYGTLHVGYVTSDDSSTFTSIASYPSSAATVHSGNGPQSAGVGLEVELDLNNVPATATRLAFKWEHQNSSYHTCCIDDVVVDYIPTCTRPTAVAVDSLSSDAAHLSWSHAGNANSFNVYYDTLPNIDITTASSITTYDTTALLTLLAPYTTYYYVIVADCGNGDYSVASHEGHFTTYLDCGPGNVYLGDPVSEGTSSSYTYFTYNYNSTSYAVGHSSNIITAQEMVDLGMEGPGTIHSLSLHAGSTATSVPLRVYVGKTTLNEFSSASDTVGLSGMTLVFNGTLVTTANQWVTIPFSTPIDYSPDSNLIVYFYRPGLPSGNGTFYYTTTTPAYRSFYGYRSSSSTANPSFTRTYYRVDMKFDICYQEPYCTRPSNIVVVDTTDSSIELSWTGCANADSYLITYGVTGSSSTAEEYSYQNSVTLYNLTPGTHYDIAIRSICGTDTTFAETIHVVTLCRPLTLSDLPMIENFDGVPGASSTSASTNNLPPCWSNWNTGTSTSYSGYPIVYNSSSYAHSGSQAMRFYTYITSGTYSDQIALMPITDSLIYPLQNLRVSFWMRSNTTSYNSWIVVGVMSDPDNASTFVPVETIYTNSSTTYAQHTVSFGGYNGPHGCVAFKAPQPTSGYNYLYIDDVILEELPDCPNVHNLRVDSLSVDWANISWHDAGTGSSWVVEYDTVDFVPGSGTAANTDYAYDTSYLMANLDTGYTYYVYVRADCGSDTSTFVGFTVTTLASLPAAVPYFCDFEGSLTNGWDFIQEAQPNYWMVGTATHNGGSKSMYVTDNGTANNYSGAAAYSFATRTFNLTDTGEYAYSYDWKCQGESSFDFLRVALVPAGTVLTAGDYSGFNNAEAPSGTMPVGGIALDGQGRLNLQSAWQTQTGTFRLHTPGTYMWVFMWRNDPSVYNTPPAAIDNVSLVRNTCPAPYDLVATHVTADSIVVTWQPGGSEMSWLVSNGQDSAEVYDTNYVFDNLNSSTGYTITVRALCDNGDTSMAIGLTVYTECLYATLPIIENFDAVPASTATAPTESYLPPCWDYFNHGTRTNYMYCPYVYSNSTYAHSGTNCIRFYTYNSSGDSNQYLILPVFDSNDYAISDLQLSFWLRGNSTSTSYFNDVVVGVMTDPAVESSFIPYDTVVSRTTTYAYHEINMNRYTGPHGRVTLLFPKPASSSQYEYGYLDDLMLGPLPNCVSVDNLTSTYVSQDTIILSWDAGGSEYEWEVVYDSGSFVSYDTFYVADNLSPNTEYTFTVRAICGAGDTSYPVTYSTRTQCGAINSLPFTESFEGLPAGSSTSPVYEIPCWGRLDNAGQNHFGYVNTRSSWAAGPHTGDNFLYYYLPLTAGTHADWIITILPPVDANLYPINTLQLSFWVRMNSATTSSFIEVGVISNVNDATTFVPVDTVQVAGDVHTLKTAYLTSYLGTGNNIALRFHRNTEVNYFFVDDFTIEEIPDCPAVSNIASPHATSDSITVTWQENGTATQWDIEYGVAGFTRGTGTTATAYTTPTYTFGGLTANTAYDVYVTPYCGGGTASTLMGTFRTTCVEAAVPFSENFDTYTTSTTSATGVHVPCWDYIMTGSSTYQGTSYQPQVYYSSSYAHSGSYSLRLYGESYTMLPPMSVPLDSLQFSFWDYCTGAAYLLEVGVMEGTTFVPVQTITTPASTHLQHTVYFGAYTGNSRVIAFRNHNSTPTTYYSYHYIDNVEVNYLPACPPVSGITADSVTENFITVSWAENGSATTWTVEYGLHGFTQGTGATATVTTTPVYTLTGLTANTAYDVYITPTCTSGTPTAIMGTFRTLCGAMTLPYTENFDSYTTSTTAATGVEVPCWDYIMTGSATYQAATYQPRVYYSSSNAHSGSYSLRLYGESYTMLPPMPTSLDSLQLTFWDYCTGAAYLLEVGVMEGTTFVPVQTISTPASTHLQHTVYFGTYTGNSRIIAFRNHNSSTTTYYSYHYIDDVMVDYLPTCPPVVALHDSTATTTTTSITIDWTDQITASAWQVEYTGNGSTGRSTVTAHPTTINGLTPATAYSVRVRPICGVGDTGYWCEPISAFTGCDLIVPPYVQDFNAVSGTAYNTAGMLPPCWGGYSNGTTTDYMPHVTNGSTYSYSVSGNALTLTSGSEAYGNTKYVRLPQFSAPVNTLTMSYWFCTESSTNGTLTVGYMTGNDFTTDFVPVVSHAASSVSLHSGNGAQPAGTGIYDTVSFDSVPANALYIAFKWVYTTSFYSCCIDNVEVTSAAPTCQSPVITSSTGDAQSHTITWSGNGTAYEVACKTTDNPNWPVATPVTTTSHTFTGLQPATVYMFRVRQDCTVDTLGYSPWTEGSFVTDSLGCVSPDSLTLTAVTNSTATFGWTPAGDETAWQVRVYNATFDSIYAPVTTATATVGGLATGVTYYAAVRALCGPSQSLEGLWSDSIQFATQTCPTVTGVATGNVTFNSVTLSWTAVANAQGYEVEYGFNGFNQGNGTTVPTTTNSITVNGLQDETSYQFYVRAVCGTNWTSENWSAPVSVTTLSAPSVTYTVSATVNPANSGNVTGTGTYAEGDTATLTATPATGYHFNRWNDNVTLNPRSVVVTSDSAFIAYFALNQYTVTVTSADSTRGTVTGGGPYNHGDVATLTATAATGYHFTQWNDGDTHATRTVTVTGDTTFTAYFGVNQYTVTATANDATMGSVTGGGQYNYRDTATLTATANTGYYFQRWNDGNVNNPRVFVVTGDVSYTAIFAADSVPPVQSYTVTLDVNDPAMGQVHGGGTFAEGSNVEINAIANAGYRFVEWNDGVTDNPRTFVLTCDTAFTATFAEQVDSTAVLVVSYDAEMGYVLINGTEAATYNGLLGDEVNLEAVALEGYHFVDWSDGETSRTRTLTLTQSRTTLTANFAVGANGIATVEGDVSCLIYPNPATSSTTISVSGANGKVRITVVDINGRVAASETMECAGDCVKTMNVDNLAQGAYFVRITGENVNMVKKLIVR